jgi:hypothetical protein
VSWISVFLKIWKCDFKISQTQNKILDMDNGVLYKHTTEIPYIVGLRENEKIWHIWEVRIAQIATLNIRFCYFYMAQIIGYFEVILFRVWGQQFFPTSAFFDPNFWNFKSPFFAHLKNALPVSQALKVHNHNKWSVKQFRVKLIELLIITKYISYFFIPLYSFRTLIVNFFSDKAA